MVSSLLAGVDCARVPLNVPSGTAVAATDTKPDLGLASLPSVNMNLLARSKGVTCEAAINALAGAIATIPANRRKPGVTYVRALAAAVADLLKAGSYARPHTCYRPMGSGSFTGQRVGYGPFKRVLDDLQERQMVEIDNGKAPFGDEPGRVTRIRGTIRFFDSLASHGIRPSNRKEHFDYGDDHFALPPLRLKAGSTRGPTWDKIPGKSIAVDWSNPNVERHATRVREINAFMSKQDFSLSSDVAFFRGFNLGDDQSFEWNKGGRLYCAGGGYQQVPSKFRKLFLFDGELTTELDISACHLTLAYGLLGVPRPNRPDLYKHPEIPRAVTKLFVTSFLGAGKAPKKWTKQHCEAFDEKDLGRLRREFPLKSITQPILALLPVLERVQDAGLTWADFQFHESEIVIDVVHRLAFEHGIVALPVHDSIIVKRSDYPIAKAILEECFFDKVGLVPSIT